MVRVLSDGRFVPRADPRPIVHEVDVDLYERLEREAEIAALQGSHVYVHTHGRSDLDVLEIGDAKTVEYESILQEGTLVSILQAPREAVERDLENGLVGYFLVSRFTRPSIVLEGEELFERFQKDAFELFARFGATINGFRENDTFSLTPSYCMQLILKARLWFEPQRWWSIYRSFFVGPEKDTNVANYYYDIERMMEERFHATGEIEKNEETYRMTLQEARTCHRVLDPVRFLGKQIGASEVGQDIQAFHLKFIGLVFSAMKGMLEHPDFFFRRNHRTAAPEYTRISDIDL